MAFTKGHVRHLRSVCISRTGSRHMGAGIGHYPGPRGDSKLQGFVSGILISVLQRQATNAGQSRSTPRCRTTAAGFDNQSRHNGGQGRYLVYLQNFTISRSTRWRSHGTDISQLSDGFFSLRVCSLQIHRNIRDCIQARFGFADWDFPLVHEAPLYLTVSLLLCEVTTK